jgi:hypothetical protein
MLFSLSCSKIGPHLRWQASVGWIGPLLNIPRPIRTLKLQMQSGGSPDSTLWREHVSKSTGKVYWYNIVTKTSTYTKPVATDRSPDATAAAATATARPAEQPEQARRQTHSGITLESNSVVAVEEREALAFRDDDDELSDHSVPTSAKRRRIDSAAEVSVGDDRVLATWLGPAPGADHDGGAFHDVRNGGAPHWRAPHHDEGRGGGRYASPDDRRQAPPQHPTPQRARVVESEPRVDSVASNPHLRQVRTPSRPTPSASDRACRAALQHRSSQSLSSHADV